MNMEPVIKNTIESYMDKLLGIKINKDVLFLLAHIFEDVANISYNIGKISEMNDFLITRANSPSKYNN